MMYAGAAGSSITFTMKYAARSRYSQRAAARSGGRSSRSTARRMCRSQASRSAAPIRNGACRIRRRGCPRLAEYVVGPPQYCIRNSVSRSAAGPRSSSGYIGRSRGSAATPS